MTTPVRFRGSGVLYFSLGSRVRGNDVLERCALFFSRFPRTPNVIPASPRHSRGLNVIPADAGTQGNIKTTVPQCPSATPVRYRGSGVLCFTLDSRVRGNDGTRAGNDVAHAGKTYEVREPRYAPHVIPADAGIQRKTKHADPLTSPSRHSRTPNVIPASRRHSRQTPSFPRT